MTNDKCDICGLEGKEKERVHKMIKELKCPEGEEKLYKEIFGDDP